MWLWMWLGCEAPDDGSNSDTEAPPNSDTETPSNSDTEAPSDTGSPPIDAPTACPPDDRPQLETTTGCVRGSLSPSGREQFLGIPFAEPPVGALRFAATVPASPWAEPLEATALGAPCVQFSQGPFNDYAVGEGVEDCLTLNVYRPAGAHDLPVMFFIHGGGHTGGSASGPYLADDPALAEAAVVVTVQYRLGPLGYLAHPELSADDPDGVSGNQGLQDVITALRWVSANLEVLGGDRLVVFGESAGGLQTCGVLASPRAADLPFDAAIVQSAPCHALSSPLRDSLVRVSGEEQGEQFATELGCDGADCLRDAALASLIALGEVPPGLTSEGWSWEPWIDGVWLPQPVSEALVSGDWNRVPVLATFNGDEGTLFTVGQSPNETALAEWIEGYALLFGVDASALTALYDPALYGGSTEAAYAALFGDVTFVCPTVWQQGVLAAQVEARGGSWLHVTAGDTLGAFHGSELPYVFGTLTDGSSPDDEALSERVRAGWRSVADDLPAIDGVGAWPTVGSGWVSIDLASTTVGAPPREEACAFFERSRANPYR